MTPALPCPRLCSAHVQLPCPQVCLLPAPPWPLTPHPGTGLSRPLRGASALLVLQIGKLRNRESRSLPEATQQPGAPPAERPGPCPLQGSYRDALRCPRSSVSWPGLAPTATTWDKSPHVCPPPLLGEETGVPRQMAGGGAEDLQAAQLSLGQAGCGRLASGPGWGPCGHAGVGPATHGWGLTRM